MQEDCDQHAREADRGAAEQTNRTIKNATVKRYQHETHDRLGAHQNLLVDAYNHVRRLEILRGLTPCEFVCHAWTSEPSRFRSTNP